MTLKPAELQHRGWPASWLFTILIMAAYAALMIATNTHFTLLDDEASSIAIAGRPIIPTLTGFFTGQGLPEEHPPTSNILLHLWLVATHHSFFFLRVFANIFFALAAVFTAASAKKTSGQRTYWTVLVLMLIWPFAFQYGRIDGWYTLSTFLVAWLTWNYVRLLDGQKVGIWVAFAVSSIFLVWTNYFGFTFLFLLLADLLLFHQQIARQSIRALLAVGAAIAAAFLPLLAIASHNLAFHAVPFASRLNWRNELATAAYPGFAIFGSAAVAPWYLPLSLPIFTAILVLFYAIWHSQGRRWLVYFLVLMAALQISGQMDIKRVLFLLPWLFVSMGIAATSKTCSRTAVIALSVILTCGWLGILSGRHYATANLYEPWNKVAEVVAQDARNRATVISSNPSFFLYLDYQLGLMSDTTHAEGADLGPALYASHGYRILAPDEDPHFSDLLRGKVVLVTGTSDLDTLRAVGTLRSALSRRCQILGHYRAAPDPAARWKRNFATNAPVLPYRTEVLWLDCP
ncbi:MAG TPA: hypothetical protein VKR52_13825 [Terracidiphilus sp.]|nr:hypothetical protein [Terracidiphilus sp.]